MDGNYNAIAYINELILRVNMYKSLGRNTKIFNIFWGVTKVIRRSRSSVS